MTDDLQHRARRHQQQQRDVDPTSPLASTEKDDSDDSRRHNSPEETQRFQQPETTKKKTKTKTKKMKLKYHLPKRIILLRHGESLGNVDENSYAHIPDWKIPLTRRGERQAVRAARELERLLTGESLFGYCSPYKRTMETWDIIEEYLTTRRDTTATKDDNHGTAPVTTTTASSRGGGGDNAPPAGVEVIGMRVEPRIAEQQFGNFRERGKCISFIFSSHCPVLHHPSHIISFVPIPYLLCSHPNNNKQQHKQQTTLTENPKKVRTAKSERRTFGRFFFRFPNGEAGLDVYNRVSSFLATLSRDIRQIDQLYSIRHDGIDDSQQLDEIRAVTRYPLDDTSLDDEKKDENDDENDGGGTKTFVDHDGVDDHPTTSTHIDAMKDMNILIVTHGLTLRLLLMRYFQLSVEEFENSYNSQNARLVIMDRFVDDSNEQREYYRLHDAAKEALNLKGDVSNEKPVYWRDTGGGDDDDDHDDGTVPPLSSSVVASVGGVGGNGGWGSAGTGRRGGLWSLPEDDDMEE